MAKYKLGDHDWYSDGQWVKKGSIIKVKDDVVPSVTWIPIDAAAKAASDKIRKEVEVKMNEANPKKNKKLRPLPAFSEEAVAEAPAVAMSEMNKKEPKKERPSDKGVL